MAALGCCVAGDDGAARTGKQRPEQVRCDVIRRSAEHDDQAVESPGFPAGRPSACAPNLPLCALSTTTSGSRPRISRRPGQRTAAKPLCVASAGSARPCSSSSDSAATAVVALTSLVLAQQRDPKLTDGVKFAIDGQGLSVEIGMACLPRPVAPHQRQGRILQAAGGFDHGQRVLALGGADHRHARLDDARLLGGNLGTRLAQNAV